MTQSPLLLPVKAEKFAPTQCSPELPISSPAFAMTTPLRTARAPAPSWVSRTHQSPFERIATLLNASVITLGLPGIGWPWRRTTSPFTMTTF